MFVCVGGGGGYWGAFVCLWGGRPLFRNGLLTKEENSKARKLLRFLTMGAIYVRASSHLQQ